MNWSNQAWAGITPIYQKMVQMPFIKELMNGTLALERFQFYIAQDSYYLEHFGRTLATIASKLDNVEDCLAFMRFAEGAIVVENALHESYFKDFGIINKGKIEPTCHHYISFLKSTSAFDPVEVAVAAVLPCFWVYKEVGNHIYLNQQSIENPYQKWIDTYAGEEFGIVVEKAIDICNRLAANATTVQQLAMTDAFSIAAQLEFEFWDSAYQLKKW